MFFLSHDRSPYNPHNFRSRRRAQKHPVWNEYLQNDVHNSLPLNDVPVSRTGSRLCAGFRFSPLCFQDFTSIGGGGGSAAMLAAILVGVSPARGTCPVATVAISGDGKGDQFIGSPEVKVPVGRAQMLGQIRQGDKQLDRS